MLQIDWKIVLSVIAILISLVSVILSYKNRSDVLKDSQVKIKIQVTPIGFFSGSNNQIITNYELRAINTGKVDFKIIEGGFTWITNTKNNNGEYVKFNIYPEQQTEKIIKPADDYKIILPEKLIVDAFGELVKNKQLKITTKNLKDSNIKLLPYVQDNTKKRYEGDYVNF